MVAVISARRIVRWKAVATSSAVRSAVKARNVAKARSIAKARRTAKALKTTMVCIIAAVRRLITARSAVASTVRVLKAIASIRKPVLPAASRVRAAVVRHLRRTAVAPSRAEPDRGL